MEALPKSRLLRFVEQAFHLAHQATTDLLTTAPMCRLV